ncbi:peptidoglycan DD-metalloendopeptidase family protein [Candidatus Dependentiae bacterium]|nr:peptidoglycan DD-metalloendopeptidase family protein [Candidatus Dependentiae bacterium]
MFRRIIRIKKIPQVLILLLVFLFSVVPFLFADKLRDSSKKLKKLDHKLSEKKSEIKEITSREKSTIELLDEIDKKLSRDKKSLTKLDLELRGLDKEIKIARKNLASSEQDLELYKRRLSRRVRAIYKFGRMNIFEIILTSDSTNEFLLKYKLLKIIAISDSRLIKKLERENEIYRKKSEEMAVKLNKLIHLKDLTEHEMKKISKEKKKRKKLLDEFSKQKKNYKKEIKALENNSKMLKEFIAGMLSTNKRAPDDSTKILIQLKGLLSWPIKGKIAGRFGKYKNKEFKAFMFRDGIEISAKKGTFVMSSFSGTVKYSGWFKGRGNMIIIEHKYGISTIYGHLDEIFVEKGDVVKTGERIGKVGNTSSIKGYILYFGVWYKEKAIDPEVLLQ